MTKDLAGYNYDTSGNLTNETSTRTMTFDAENRTATFNGGSGTTTYTYDGDGRRVKKVDNAGVTSVYVYNAQGQLAAEYSTQASTVPGGTSYVLADPLGSTRVMTHPDGTIRGRHDYLPFGEEIGTSYGGRSSIPGYGAVDIRQKFTTKERDSESNLDYFGARYFSGAQGRFMSVDPQNVGANAGDPQSWNGYAYARNSPLVYIDPTGEKYTRCIGEGDKQKCEQIRDSEFDQYREQNRRELIFEKGKIFARDKEGGRGAQVGTYVQTDRDLNPFAQAFVAEMDRRSDASMTAIGIAAAAGAGGGLLVAGGLQVAAGYGVSQLTTLGLNGLYILNGLKVSAHALQRMSERGVSLQQVESTILNGQSFQYFHNGVWKTGYYDSTTKIFVGKAGSEITTVIGKASQSYINNLKSAKP